MTHDTKDEIYVEAVRWHSRIEDPAMDWDEFAAWLDVAPENQGVYDELALLDQHVSKLRPYIDAALPANDEAKESVILKSPGRWTRAFGGAVAAIFIGVIGLTVFSSRPAPFVLYATGPAQSETITLKDGSTILMDRSTRIELRDGTSRDVKLTAGAAYFDIQHDKTRPFIVSAGAYRARDIGTRFSVSRQDDQVSVSVASGLVEVRNSGKPSHLLRAGQRLDGSEITHRSEIHAIEPGSIGSWRQGRLVYDNVPLALVAADVGRYANVQVSVDPAVANLKFSSVMIIGDGSHLVDQIEALLPVKAQHGAGTVHFVRARGR